MTIPNPIQNEDWARWLDAVTAPFPAATATRLLGEYLAHLGSSRDALQDAGLSPTAAEKEALHRLGPADDIRQALEQKFFTSRELAWLGRDASLREHLDDVPRPAEPVTALDSLLTVVGIGLSTWLLCGLPGLSNPLFPDRGFSWEVPVLLGATAAVSWLVRAWLGTRTPRSAAVLNRVWQALVPPWFVVILVGSITTREPMLMLTSVLTIGCLTYFRRPREALSVLRKALHNAR